MIPAAQSPLSSKALLERTFRVYREGFLLFFCFIAFIPLAWGISAYLMLAVLFPPNPSGNLRELWGAMSGGSKLGVVLLFIGMFAVMVRTWAATIHATSELNQARPVRFLDIVKRIRRRQLRLFWFQFLAAGVLMGPGAVVSLALAFFFGPSYPVAVLENCKAAEALKRGSELSKNGYGRIALLFLVYVIALLAAIGAWVGVAKLTVNLLGRTRLNPALNVAYLLFPLVVTQLWMIGLTVNYHDQLSRKAAEAPAIVPVH